MKRYLLVAGMITCSVFANLRAAAQAEEFAQLLLNIEKLAQFRQILSDLKKGYDILYDGYSTIKGIAQGNFSLHKLFLDGLTAVSPAVKNYERIGDIINYQLQLAKEYKSAYGRFRQTGNFSVSELEYISSVYNNLVQGSLGNLDALAMVITSGKTRMSDDERIAVIDGIFRDMEEKLSFLRWFNSSASVLVIQRFKERNDLKVLQGLY